MPKSQCTYLCSPFNIYTLPPLPPLPFRAIHLLIARIIGRILIVHPPMIVPVFPRLLGRAHGDQHYAWRPEPVLHDAVDRVAIGDVERLGTVLVTVGFEGFHGTAERVSDRGI